MNNTRILFWGIQRSGNHGIINWIWEQFDDPKMFLNNQLFGKDLQASPQQSLESFGIEHNKSVRFIYSQKHEKNWRYLWNNPPKGINQLLLVSFENHDISHLSEESYRNGCNLIDDSVVGKSLNTINIIILRDPFNMWVSNMPGNKPQNPDLWKIYAKEYLGQTNILPNKVSINYNQWFSDPNYRMNISEKLGIAFSDNGLNVVGKFGGGSSFNKTAFDGQAQRMSVLNRWEESNNFKGKIRLLRSLGKDKELSKLVKIIYPELYQKWNRLTLNNFCYYWGKYLP